MRKLNTLAFAVLAGLSGSCLAQAELMSVDQNSAIEDQYIVVFKTPAVMNASSSAAISNYAASQAQALSTQHNVQVTQHFDGVLNGVVVTASKQKVQELLSNPSIDYIEQDQIVTVTPMVDASADQGNAIWGLDRVDQRDLPLNSNYHYDFDGSGVTAYVIDTGVRITHAEFGGRASHGYDFVDNDADSSDCNGHGTHVAGTIGGGAYGVAKNVNVVGVRVLGCNGSGSYSGVISGIDWVKNNASGPSVANMSLGGGVSQAVDDAVNAAVASGVTFVVAAGNDNSSACNYSPARAADAVTVGSTTSSDARSSFSNYGNCLDIYAPGSSIKSAWYNSDSATNTISGTSMAAPHVAGVVALYLDENPSLTPSQIDSLLSSRSSKNKVSDAKSGSPNELLFSLADSTPPPPPPPLPELDDGVAVNASGANGEESNYLFKVPAGKTTLTVKLSGGTGDADLYVQQGQQPTQSSYSCRPYKSGNEEVCTFNNPVAGDWYIMLHGYSAYSGASLVASTAGDGGGCGNNCLSNGVPVTNLSGASGSEVAYTIDVPANATVNVQISGGSGDADLYVRKGAAPTTSTYDCRPYRNGNAETCSLTNTGGDATYHIMLRGYNAYSGVTLTGSY
ncbi:MULTISPECIES: S8 family peptidase [Pseudoalteromonas]|uniref:Subtilisin-like serine protease n=1 Tax=Pseudoalteromonas luteoviolacea (strain 2ta16) TaxID=1353533 RepID=V4HKS8_PSEL2|nr:MULTISPECIES: S8 family peptidase [Pseudoalteromonas]ESP90348.1 subtilisin-like serine protease [Pseudoalteromonas luteoviolacea 2ta16]KZN39877.1 alkaline serine protease [Pseudoalteromonas luteoviolacea NCIMB 1944]MCG7547048.1 S8 family peptidase [Pseudoalteromonas sp. Of7M-16]